MPQSAERNPRTETLNRASISDYIKAFSNEATNPPGQDRCMGAFYTALTNLALEDPKVESLIQNIAEARSITPQHFTNLIFRAVQFIELFEKKNDSYPSSYTESYQWREELQQLIKDYKGLMIELLLTKDTATTIYQRYAGTKAVLNLLFPNQKIKVADFGCGANYGLPGLAKDLELKPITDQTPNQLVTQLLKSPLNLKEGLAVDKVNPQDPNEKKWRLACSFYPKELGQLADLMIFETKIADVEGIKFLQEDLLGLNGEGTKSNNSSISLRYFDAVVMNTLCYQLNPEEQDRIFDIAHKSLNPRGVIIVQDFVLKDSSQQVALHFLQNWFKEPYPYRTFISGRLTDGRFKEFLQWSNGRCTNVRAGEDFEELLTMQN